MPRRVFSYPLVSCLVLSLTSFFLHLSFRNALQVHQKELLLQDLIRGGVFGSEQCRRVGPKCSRRIYRIFMAQNGNLKTDDVEGGADQFDDSD